jgi:hypothetical protein
MEKYQIGKFLVLLQEDGSLKIVATEHKDCISVKPITANSVVIYSV